MFYLQTKDGERFFTSATSEDKVEFAKIIEKKLGSDAELMLTELLKDAYEAGEESAEADNLQPVPWDEIDTQAKSLRHITSELWTGLAAVAEHLDKDQITQFESYFQKLDSVAYQLEHLE